MKNTKETLSEKIYQNIYDDITQRNLSCGQKLTLKALAQEYDVSNTPIREALSRLSENGLVTYYSNCGVKVIDFSEADIQDLFRFVSELDALSVQYCETYPIRDAFLHELRGIVEAGNSLLAAGDLTEWDEYSKFFHKTFYKFAQSPCLDNAADKLRPRVELLSYLYYPQISREKVNEDHNRIFQTILDGDFARAAELMRAHVQYDMIFAVKAYADYKESLK